MANKKQPLVIGNWKMHPRTMDEATVLAKAVAKAVKKINGVHVVIVPPLLYLSAVSKTVEKTTVALGVQHIHPGPVGAFTGEVSPAMVAPFGVTYALVGHSEKRAQGVTDADVNAAVMMLLKHRMIPVICVGEVARDEDAKFYGVIKTQIASAVSGVPVNRFRDIVIAYEPIWAIGTGTQATPADVMEMKLFIQKILTELVGRNGAAAVTILYGGSVRADTAAVLYREGGVNGFLVGGASLVPTEFAAICQSII